MVLKSTYPAPLLLNPRPCGVLAIVDVHSAARRWAAVEWWASFIEADQAITLAGATVLRFDSDGLVVDHVDYWVQSPGRTVPYAGWGKAGPPAARKGASIDD